MVEILDETNRFERADQLERALAALLGEQGAGDRSLTVVLLDDDAMRRRNRDDRGIDSPTDVLSYPTHEPDDIGSPQVEHLGDVFVSLETAARQGAERGHGTFTEVLILAAHGLTHLQGFDHPDPERWRRFREAERRIVALARGTA